MGAWCSKSKKPIEKKNYDVHLSHVWATGQKEMRIVKTKLLKKKPDLKVFLDVDDLKDVSDISGYLERSACIFIFCSNGYFKSTHCMKSLVSCYKMEKKIIACLHGLNKEEIKTQLAEAEGMYEKWGFADDTPKGEQLYGKLFEDDAIEWGASEGEQNAAIDRIVMQLSNAQPRL